jgi:hypothetical protein
MSRSDIYFVSAPKLFSDFPLLANTLSFYGALRQQMRDFCGPEADPMFFAAQEWKEERTQLLSFYTSNQLT